MNAKTVRFGKCITILALAVGCLSARASDWTAGVGDWSDPANWSAGVPDNTGGWTIGNVQNNGTAIVSTTVPPVSEAWAGNSGGVGTIIITNGGTLPVDNWLVVGRTGPNGNTPLSTLVVGSGGVINKRGDGFIIGDGNYCFGQVFVVGTGQINVTGGWNGFGNGTGGEGWLTLQDDAVFNTPGQDFNIGDWGSGRAYAVIKDNARLNVSRFWVGKTGTTLGVLTQTGGTILGTGGNANEWCIGGENTDSPTSYGFYNLMGGTFINPFNFQIGRYGQGVLYQSGGAITQGGWCAVGRYNSGIGVLYITGGQFNHTNTANSLIIAEAGSHGEMTIAGTAAVTTSREFAIGNSGTGFVNLNGGSLTVPRITKWAGSGYLNFNGGTLKPTVADPAFLGGLNEARVYAGNAIIDTAGLDIGITQPLLGVSGMGVTSIPVTDGGMGYVAPPIVQIVGDGIGAQAIAQVDPVAGRVTSIVITCPGYAYSTVPSVMLYGGGATVEATIGMAVLGEVTSGGLIKNGAGTLTLDGANDYTGATVVNAGGLVLNNASVGGGPITIADGVALGLKVQIPGGQLFAGSITLGTSAATTLNVDLGAFGNPLAAPLATSSTLAVNGTVTVNISDDFPQVGSFPVVQYGNRSGSGSFVLGPLPTGVEGHLATNSPNTLDLVITAVAAPRWAGTAGGTWDVAQTLNWTELSTGSPTYYNDGLVALFDDAAVGTTTVDLVTNVEPGSVVVNNTNLAYTILGTGKIGGGGGLTKRGTNSLTLATLNEYTGPSVIAAGSVMVTNLANGGQPSAIGKSSAAAANLVLSGGTLSYSGPAKTIDRGYAVQGTGTGIDVQSDLSIGGQVTATPNTRFVKSGPAKLSYVGAVTNELSGGAFPGYNVLDGTVVFDGSAGRQVNHSQNEFWVGSTTNVGASLLLTNTTLNIDSWLAVGRGNGSANYLSTLTLNNAAARSGNFSMGYNNGMADNFAQQVMTLNGTSTFTNAGDVNMGESGGSTSTLSLNGNSKFFSDGRAHFGWHNNSTGIVTIAESAAMFIDAWLSIGHEGGVGTFTVKNNSSLWVLWDLNVTDVGLGEGTFNLQDNATATANNFFIGKGVGSSGVFNQTGGSAIGILNAGNEFHIGFHGAGTWNLSAGSILAPNHWFIVGRWADGPGILNVTGGTIIHGTNDTGKLFRVGEDGTGTLNLSGTGTIETSCNEVTIGWNATGNGTVNLDAGTFQARRIIGGAGFSMFNFNGGVLRAGPNANLFFMTNLTAAYVNGGGAVIDSGANVIAINQDLLMGSGNGGLTKIGSGALALNGVNTYTGPTLVNAGALAGTGVISGPVTVASGAYLAPGAYVGTLSISNTLTLASGSATIIEIDKANSLNDRVEVLSTVNYGGTLVLTNLSPVAENDTFTIFQAGTYNGSFTTVLSNPGVTWDTSRLAIDGTVKVLSTVSTTPPALGVTTASGGTELVFSWPADHLGWRLLEQTNNLNLGVSSNLADWATVAGSSGATQVTVPISKTKPAGFFRLVYP
ncbi:MAG TPA: autotransporter-associated beta strand repeat-containing protein [Verrucomicrobiae bacterium]